MKRLAHKLVSGVFRLIPEDPELADAYRAEADSCAELKFVELDGPRADLALAEAERLSQHAAETLRSHAENAWKLIALDGTGFAAASLFARGEEPSWLLGCSAVAFLLSIAASVASRLPRDFPWDNAFYDQFQAIDSEPVERKVQRIAVKRYLTAIQRTQLNNWRARWFNLAGCLAIAALLLLAADIGRRLLGM